VDGKISYGNLDITRESADQRKIHKILIVSQANIGPSLEAKDQH